MGQVEGGGCFASGRRILQVARNIFLDGNSFVDSRRVDRLPLVGDVQFGLVLDWSDIRLSYIRVLRSREFRGQHRHDDFGAVMLSFRR